PLLKKKGKLYQKSKNIYARPAKMGEVIQTVTSDGLETENRVTKAGSFVVQNQTKAAEQYIVEPQIFQGKYEFLEEVEGDFALYRCIGKIKVLKLTRKLWERLDFAPQQIYFEAPWGQKMVLKLYDYMVCPLDYSEVYRIARKEFWETYQKV
ncbi:MAG: hypothetical protein AAGJ18_15680, partial [Bacteroidota bacterium]